MAGAAVVAGAAVPPPQAASASRDATPKHSRVIEIFPFHLSTNGYVHSNLTYGARQLVRLSSDVYGHLFDGIDEAAADRLNGAASEVVA